MYMGLDVKIILSEKSFFFKSSNVLRTNKLNDCVFVRQLEVQFEYDSSFYGRDNILASVNFSFILFYVIEQVRD